MYEHNLKFRLQSQLDEDIGHYFFPYYDRFIKSKEDVIENGYDLCLVELMDDHIPKNFYKYRGNIEEWVKFDMDTVMTEINHFTGFEPQYEF